MPIKRSDLNIAQLGKFPRAYDELTENGTDKDKVLIAEVMQWMEDPIPANLSEDKSKNKNTVDDLIQAGYRLHVHDKLAAIEAIQGAHPQVGLLDKAGSVFGDLWYATRDMFAGRRIKTSLAVVAGIGVGAALGAVLGTVVFPGIGTAIGGTAGAAVAGLASALGGTIGLSIIGAFLGSYAGSRFSSKFFKHEKHFELSKRVTGRLKKKFGLKSEVANMMNGYLYNRYKAVESPLCKKYYKTIRQLGIEEGESVGMEKIARFFCHELLLLEAQRQNTLDDPMYQNEINGVLYILKSLKNSSGLAAVTKENIASVLESYEERKSNDQNLSEQSVPLLRRSFREYSPSPQPKTLAPAPKFKAVPPPPPALSAPAPTLTPARKMADPKKTLESMKEQFLQELHHQPYHVTKCQAIEDRDLLTEGAPRIYRFHITTTRQELPEIVLQAQKPDAEYLAEVFVDRAQITDANRSEISQVLVAQAKAYYQKTGNPELVVIARADDQVAIQLMAAALVAGLSPKLDDREYPANTPVQVQKREQVIQAAYRLAQMEAPQPKLRPKIGLKIPNPNNPIR